MIPVAIVSVLTAVLSILSVAATTRVYRPYEFGQSMLWMGAITLVDIAVVGPFSYSLLKFTPRQEGRGRDIASAVVSARLVWKRLRQGALVLVSGAGLAAIFSPAVPATVVWGIIFSSAFVLLNQNFRLLQIILNLKDLPTLYAWSTFIDILSSTLGVVMAGFLFHGSANAYLGGLVAGRLFSYGIIWGIPAYRRDFREIVAVEKSRHEPAQIQYMSFYAPLVVSAVVGWLSTLGDRYLVSGIRGVAAAGYFAAAVGFVGKPYNIVTSTLTTYFKPKLFSSDEVVVIKRHLWHWSCAAAFIGLLGVAACRLFGATIIRAYFTPIYASNIVGTINILAVAYTLYIISHACENAIIALNRNSQMLAVQIIAIIVFAILCVLCLPKMGLWGAGLAKASAYGTQVVLNAVLVAVIIRRGTAKRNPASEANA